MPELPEVEVVVRGLRPLVVGRRITDFATRQPKAINLPPEEFRARVRQRVVAVERRGKSAVLRLAADSLWLHRGLNGQVLYDPPGASLSESDPAPMVALAFDDGARLRLEKLFMGHAHLLTPAESAAREAELGVDALSPDLTVEWLSRLAEVKPNLGAKALLMDQALLAGIGNVYSDEVLHRAGISPARKLGSLSVEELRRLHRSIGEGLGEAVERGGDETYTDVAGRPGSYTSRIHGRETCTACGGPVQRAVLGGRGAYFCPRCQR